MIRRALVAGALLALAFASAAATCRSESARGPSGDQAVPTEVEIDWPDAAVMPPPRPAAGDAGA